MKKLTLLLLFGLLAVVSTWGQSTFTILPKFQVGDTLLYEVQQSKNKEQADDMLACKDFSRKFYLIIKEKDREGNFKVDYLLKETNFEIDKEVRKEFVGISQVEKFLTQDILKIPILLTIDRAGRLLDVDNKDEVDKALANSLVPMATHLVNKTMKRKLTADEKKQIMESLTSKFSITDVFDEIPALFKYYGQPLIEGKSETVDSVTTKYIIARMGDGTTWLKANIDFLNGEEVVTENNPGEEFLEESDDESEDESFEDILDLGIAVIQEDEYKYNKEGIVTYLKYAFLIGSKDVNELDSSYQSKTEVNLLAIKKKQ
ncbi:hypothetical protein [Prevotella aurantiaca]|uniref:hypothetical protein n=1 Tax=Prevotella aurantiaca TaxID=596085 RepID=UPI0023544CE1|nr:hypothetical protein [Prevotella aurantiaca]